MHAGPLLPRGPTEPGPGPPVTGLPAMSIPCGFSEAGLPIGMQVVGAAFDEPMVFKVADAYQRLTDWHLRVPEIAREAQPA